MRLTADETRKRRTQGVNPGQLIDDPQVDGVIIQNQHPAGGVKGEEKELKYIEKRYDDKGRQYVTDHKESDPVEDKAKWFERYVLCVTLHLDRSNKIITHKTLAIHSKYIKGLLAELIGDDYPNVSFTTNDISLPWPHKGLFFYRNEIRCAAATKFAENADATEHVDLLLDLIEDDFKDTIRESENLIAQGKITYEHLWTIMRPGTAIFSTSFGQPIAHTLTNAEYVTGNCQNMRLTVTSTDFDGQNFGRVDGTISVYPWRGTQSIDDLNALPIKFHPEQHAMKQRLIARGRKFESLAGQHFRQYRGLALSLNTEEGLLSVNGRVMIDTMTSNRINSNTTFNVLEFKADGKPMSAAKRRRLANGTHLTTRAVEEHDPLTDDQAMKTNPLVRGFCFTHKKFGFFVVDQLEEIRWNTGCFDQLVLPETHKNTVQALVSMHTKKATQAQFDDIVKGKGKGLVLVLHGPPGVGKTLTAECVAEYAHRPLYIVSSGDLGTNSSTLDTRLSRALDLASTFKAVLLIDEADVFLSKRSLHDLERNALVSIFLRTLEYYEGILFLTTNRVNDFDDAFKSRIHIPLRYTPLPPSSRKAIWKNFLGQVDGGCDIDEAGYDQLSEAPLNGRQIKNTVRTAVSLAEHNERPLDLEQVDQVLKIQVEFENDLSAASE